MGIRQSDGTVKTDYAGRAAHGKIVVSSSSGRRRRFLSSIWPFSSQKDGIMGSKKRHKRNLMQTCTLEAHKKVHGDINFDCKFEFVSDLVAMAEIFGEWNPDLDNFPQRKCSLSLKTLS